MANINGDSGNNTLIGTALDDVILGFGGNDTLDGGDGNDRLNPGSSTGGQERIYGSAGSDTLIFSDTLSNGGTTALVYDLSPSLVLNIDGVANTGQIAKSGVGVDTLVDIAKVLNGNDLVIWGSGQGDTFTVNGTPGSYIAIGGSEGNDTYNLTLTGEIRLIFDGSWFDYATQGVVLNLSSGIISNDGFGFTDRVNITGTADSFIQIYASNLNDSITGSDRTGEVYILAGGNDTLAAGGGDDLLRFNRDNMTSGVRVDLATGSATGSWEGTAFSHTISGVERVRGAIDFGNVLLGSAADEELEGYNGNDHLDGRAGDDYLDGHNGNDTIIGGAGRDVLVGGAGDDLIDASQGDSSTEGFGDFIRPGSGSNTIIGNASAFLTTGGIDVSYFDVTGANGITATRGENGNVRVQSQAPGVVNDTITFAHFFYGTFGNDDFIGQTAGQVQGVAGWGGLQGNDRITGGIGIDVLSYLEDGFFENGRSGAVITFIAEGSGTAVDGFGDTDSFSGIEGVLGTNTNDVVTGSDGAERVYAEGGNDRLLGGGGNDSLNGGRGSDTLNGGAGDDILNGGSRSFDEFDRLDYPNEADPIDDLRDVIFGGDGNDSADGGAGNDEIFGGNGNDTLVGGFGSDTLVGNDGADLFLGAGGSDLIFGNAGSDFINGGFGFDRINGGEDADRFFHQGVADHGSDWIQDYSATQGDRLVAGIVGATASQFQVNFANTSGAGAGDVAEAFIIYRPSGQILWALVDGAGQSSINLQVGAQVTDLLL